MTKIYLTNELIDQKLSDNKIYIQRLDNYENNTVKMQWQCLNNISHKWSATTRSIFSKKIPCPFCETENRHRQLFKRYVNISNKKHNNKFTYIKLFIEDNTTMLEIECKKHGIFTQKAQYHIIGGSCIKCYHDSLAYSLEEFIFEAKKVHENKYQYIKLERTGGGQTIHIYCPKHNHYFSQKTNNHLHGDRCPLCTQEKIRWQFDEFVEAAQSIHGNTYKYLHMDYSERSTKIVYECQLHGIMIQYANTHLHEKGCKLCHSKISKKERKWLALLGLPDDKEHRNVKFVINNKVYFADGFDPITNTIYEFLGNYWHGNPQIYSADQYNDITHCTHGELYQKTINKLNSIKNAKYNLIYIWEKDWDQNYKEWEKIKQNL